MVQYYTDAKSVIVQPRYSDNLSGSFRGQANVVIGKLKITATPSPIRLRQSRSYLIRLLLRQK